MQFESSSFQISREQLFNILDPFGSTRPGGRPNEEEPHKPGPWDPVIRRALKDLGGDRFGPFPEPWRHASSLGSLLEIVAHRFPQIWEAIGGSGLADRVALNPQPLPPRCP